MSPSSRGFVLLSLLVSFLLPVLALQANLAGIVDWHKPLIGPPILDPTPPRIFDTAQGRRVVSITSKNVLACLDGENGDIVWRHLLDERDPVVSYHVQDDAVLLLSGSGGFTARLVSLATGQIIWEKTLLQQSPRLTVPVHLGTDVGFSPETNSVLILSDGRRITRLDKSTGNQLWSLEAPGVGDTILFKQLLVSGSAVHILALSSGFSKTSLVTLSLSLETSAPLGDLVHVPSIISNPSQALLALSSTDGSAQVVWSEHGRIRSAEIDAKGKLGKTKDLMPGKGHVYDSLSDVGARHQGYVLGQMENMAVQIIDVRNGAEIVEEFEASHRSEDKSESVYTASSSKSGVTFSRVYWSFSLNLAVARTYTLTPEGSIATGFTFPFDTLQHGVLQAAAVSPTIGPETMPQILLTTSSGASLLVEQDASKWLREESLADIAAVRFVSLGEREVEQVGHLLTEETFLQRTSRHLLALKDLPSYLIGFASRFTSSSYSSKLALPPLNSTNLHRDQFGLQKLLVAVTRSGKVIAMDSSTGASIWSYNLGLLTQTGSKMEVEGMWLVREVGEGVNPTLAVLARKTDDDTTVGFHIDAFTGEVSGDHDETTGLPLGKTLFSGAMKTAFLTPHENCSSKNRVLAVVDPRDKLHIFPYCKTLAKKISDEAELSYTALSESLGSRTLIGSKVGALSDRIFSTTSQWSHRFANDEVVHSVQPVGFNSIASFGRMLGDKSTMYKYLNPHLVVVSTSNPIKGTGSVVVLDSLVGRVVYSVSMDNVEVSRGIAATMTENWLVFAWLEKGAGWRITSVEMYEDADKGRTPEVSSYAQWQDPNILSKTFIAPGPIRYMTTTQSKFGIAAKEIVYVNDRGQIAHIPRRLLDPRRPIGKPSSSDKEEMLIPYDPMIPPEPKRVVSHKYQVLGATSLTSSPALVESTSLLLAHGLDLFMTRGLNPSGTFDILSDTFNKFQLLITLAVLSIGISVARPAVTKKMLKARWF